MIAVLKMFEFWAVCEYQRGVLGLSGVWGFGRYPVWLAWIQMVGRLLNNIWNV